MKDDMAPALVDISDAKWAFTASVARVELAMRA